MPRGGARVGAGRPRKNPDAPARKRAAPKSVATGFSEADGKKAKDAPADWPFGTVEPKAPDPAADHDDDQQEEAFDPNLMPLDYLLSVVRDTRAKPAARMQCAAIAAPYVHAKPAPLGKKEGKQQAAKTAANRFATPQPPKLVVSNR